MTELHCDVNLCDYTATINAGDLDVVAAARQHMEKEHGFGGSEMIGALARSTTGDPTAAFATLDYPGVGMIDRRPPRDGIGPPLTPNDHHAVPPGWVTVDGRGPAMCSSLTTVVLDMAADGWPVRAVSRWQGFAGTARPGCRRCATRVQHWQPS